MVSMACEDAPVVGPAGGASGAVGLLGDESKVDGPSVDAGGVAE